MDVTPSSSGISVALRQADLARHAPLRSWADRPGLHVLEDEAWTSAPLALELRDTGLWLLGRTPEASGAAQVDLVGGRLGARLRRSSLRSEALLRAVGASDGRRPQVLDATAGWGRDTALLAQHGCHVLAFERSAAMALLLEDGLRRANQEPVRRELASRIQLHHADAGTHLSAEPTLVDPAGRSQLVVVMDPMFPERRRSSLVRLPLRLAAALVGRDDDAPDLLALALESGAARVVVRRPTAAPPLDSRAPPRFSVPGGRTTRYDVYMSG